MISSKLATLHELETIYSVGDLYRLAEIIRVDTFNNNLGHKWATREEAR